MACVARASALVSELWFPVEIRLTDEWLELGGWALPPSDPDLSFEITVNGEPFDEMRYFDRPEIAPAMWMHPGAERCGFEGRVRRERAMRDGRAVLECVHPERPDRYWFQRAFVLVDPDREPPMPEPGRIYRVIGDPSGEMYKIGGATDFTRLDLLLQELTGRGFAGQGRILDWGCGCGRVARHVAAAVAPGALTGADIDRDNVQWCNDHLAGATFVHVPLHPPMPFADASFDLVYGISVFTHLREDEQFRWLSELQRITAPGALLLVTIHNRTVVDYAMVSPEEHARLSARIDDEGFFVNASNDQLEGQIDDDDYYVNVFHSHDYVRNRWSDLFEVVDILPGFLHTHDLVVLRRDDRALVTPTLPATPRSRPLRRLAKAFVVRTPGLRAAYARRVARQVAAADAAAPPAPAPAPPPADPPTWVPAGHFYSPIPGPEQVEAHRRRADSPLPESLVAVDLNTDGQLELLRALRAHYADQPFTAEPQEGVRYYFENDQYSYGDAIFLHCMLRELWPRRVIEVGSGYSSAVTLDTNELFLDGSIDVTCIEPYPDRLLSLLKPGDTERMELIRSGVQDVPLERFGALEAGDILFIDSTHVSKTESDVNYLVLEVLPRLAAGVVVHFHDIFYPFDYPVPWVSEGRAWNEAYLLRAFLAFNESFEIVLFSNQIAQMHFEVIERDFPLCARNPGGSIWLRKRR